MQNAQVWTQKGQILPICSLELPVLMYFHFSVPYDHFEASYQSFVIHSVILNQLITLFSFIFSVAKLCSDHLDHRGFPRTPAAGNLYAYMIVARLANQVCNCPCYD